MDLNTLQVALGVGLPVGGSLATLGWFGWKREKRRRFSQALEREQQRRQLLLTGSALLRPQGDLWKRANGEGQIAVLAVGGYASSQLPYLLQSFERAGAPDHIGTIYLLDLDKEKREICLDNLPAVFRSRVVTVDCPLMPGGAQGDPPEETQAAPELWKQNVLAGAHRWLNQMQRETTPALLFCLLSPGGMAGLGYPVVQAFHERYPRLPVYVTTILDHKTTVRQRFPHIRELYCRDGLVRGTIITDNLRLSSRSDLGIALLFAAMVAAPWVSQHPLELWNGLAYVFPKKPTRRKRTYRYATISVWAEMLPLYHIPARHGLPAVFYTKADLLEEKITRGVRTLVERPELQAIPLEPAPRGATRLCYAIAPIVPEPDFRAVAARVDANLEEWRVRTDPDLLIHYASLAAPMSPSTQEVPLVLVLFQPLADDGKDLDSIALGSHVVDPKFLSAAARSAPTRRLTAEGA